MSGNWHGVARPTRGGLSVIPHGITSFICGGMRIIFFLARVAAGVFILWLAYKGLVSVLEGQWWTAGFYILGAVVANIFFFGLLFPKNG